jgi:hypothetical protein
MNIHPDDKERYERYIKQGALGVTIMEDGHLAPWEPIGVGLWYECDSNDILDFYSKNSFLWWLNLIILQWLFIRLTQYCYWNWGYSYEEYGYELRIGVLPLTGFWNRHIELPVKIRLTEKHESRN